MKIIRIITVVLFMLSATATVNAAVLDKAPTSFVIKLQVPPPPPHPPGPIHLKAPPRPVVRHRRVVVRRPPAPRKLHITLPHIKLPPHPPGPPGGPPRL